MHILALMSDWVWFLPEESATTVHNGRPPEKVNAVAVFGESEGANV